MNFFSDALIVNFGNAPSYERMLADDFRCLDQFETKSLGRFWVVGSDVTDDLFKVANGSRGEYYFESHEESFCLASSVVRPPSCSYDSNPSLTAAINSISLAI